LTSALAAELAPGIRVNCICPGFTKTGFNAPAISFHGEASWQRGVRELVPLGREAEPDETARGIFFLISNSASYITGHKLILDGGMLR
jgi:NAD(P)-dependent dehydrogenase (short-subunit alcohol dehydrogenase family)